MHCPYCRKEYFDKNQKICEYCGLDLLLESATASKPAPPSIEPKNKLELVLNDLGLKDFYKKIKKSYDNLKEKFKDI